MGADTGEDPARCKVQLAVGVQSPIIIAYRFEYRMELYSGNFLCQVLVNRPIRMVDKLIPVISR